MAWPVRHLLRVLGAAVGGLALGQRAGARRQTPDGREEECDAEEPREDEPTREMVRHGETIVGDLTSGFAQRRSRERDFHNFAKET